MIKKIVPVVLSLTVAITAIQCQQADNTQSSNSDSLAETAVENAVIVDTSLYATLDCRTMAPNLRDSLIIKFTVTNPTKDTLKFTTYHTPFEGFLSKFLIVKDSEGNEAQYLGPMAKRVMPPPAATYHAVAPGQSESVNFNLKKGYKIEKAGTYTIQYNSELISGVANGKAITIKIVQ
ncbi:hypothetical protein [Arachidicoccus terrestris]|uniref:hypothetical protein n=1 Tax=Arachidicoccus terrestris TaxID=2875539 RepID=UPI001CC73DB1|nr:hypothetical protein [Arachidicoccus terrestris]UAY54633.1 hypothetical protein K9M52_14435 [Arachidicoccus terrestris]